MKEIRYSPEDSREEAEKMKDLVGNKATREDLDIAESILNRESHKSGEKILNYFEKGYILVFPPNPHHTFEIGINTEDARTLFLFNAAAREVLGPYGAFHQLGSGNKTGESTWELLGAPRDLSDEKVHRLARYVYKKMCELDEKYKGIDLEG